MGLRKKPRIKMVVPVRLWGMDSAGKPFNVLAYTLNVSASGARIGGVKVPIGVGEAVTIQYKQQRALFKVVWVGQPGDQTREQIGVTLLEQDRQIWTEINDPVTFEDSFSGRRSERRTPPPPAPPPPDQEPAVAVEMLEAAEDSTQAAADAPSPAPEELPVLPSAPARDPDEVVRACARGLIRIEQVVKNSPPSAEALQEFRDAIAKIRQTVWALQQWHEVKNEGRTAFPLLAYLNTERLRFVVQAVQDLSNDMATKGVEVDPAMLDKFLQSVQQLRARRATPLAEPQGFSVEVVPPDGSQASGSLVDEIKAASSEVSRSGMNTEAALGYLAREIKRVVAADGVSIARRHEGEMLCVDSSGNAAEAGMVLETESGLGGEAMRTRHVAYCSNTASDPRVDADLCRQAHIGSVAMVPVGPAGDPPIGMFEVSSARVDAFGPAHLDALRAAADIVASLLGKHGVSA